MNTTTLVGGYLYHIFYSLGFSWPFRRYSLPTTSLPIPPILKGPDHPNGYAPTKTKNHLPPFFLSQIPISMLLIQANEPHQILPFTFLLSVVYIDGHHILFLLTYVLHPQKKCWVISFFEMGSYFVMGFIYVQVWQSSKFK